MLLQRGVSGYKKEPVAKLLSLCRRYKEGMNPPRFSAFSLKLSHCGNTSGKRAKARWPVVLHHVAWGAYDQGVLQVARKKSHRCRPSRVAGEPSENGFGWTNTIPLEIGPKR
jgi:hypothetical protein